MAMARGMTDSRAKRKSRRDAALTPPQPDWQRFSNPFPPLTVLDNDGLARIDDTALKILEELGLQFQNPEALDIMQAHGAEVDRESAMVRMDRGLVREMVAKAPASFTLHARNPDRNVTIGGNWVNFAPVGGPPFVSDLDLGRRPGTFADQCNLIRLHQSLNVLHLAGAAPVEATDLPAESRHLDFYEAQITLTDRAWNARAIGSERVEDALEMVALARGRTREQLIDEPSLLTVINVNSPRIVDNELLAGLMAMTRNGQGIIVTPFTLAGAMSPVTIAGALAQQTAEAMGVIAFSQMLRPGAPVIMGGFTSNVDMKSGAPAFGTPEYVQAVIAGGQIARRWGLPYRSSNVNSSNVVDAQAAAESMMSLWASIMSHANLVNHAVGWLEGGLTASLEKSVLDAELIGSMRAWMRPLEVDDDSLAFEAIAETPPGAHFFGNAHTMARYQTAFHSPMLADLRPFETWAEDGAHTATDRANRLAKTLLQSYQAPPLEIAVRDAVSDYVARRKAQTNAH